MKILIATEGSQNGKEMVKKVSARSFASNTKMRIISAYEKISHKMFIHPIAASSEYYTEIDKHSLKVAENAVESAAVVLKKNKSKFSITTAVVEGSPKEAILEAAEAFGANWIIVGSHGYGAVERFLLGSVSQSVALHAKCSVEIVRK